MLGVSIVAGMLTSCATPPLTLYILAPAPPIAHGYLKPLTSAQSTLEVVRVALPDYLDTDDIMVRAGDVILTSHKGRWASRLSLGATDLITDELTRRLPDFLVTDEPLSTPPTYRVIINVRRLEVTSSGLGVLEADWLIFTVQPNILLERSRGGFQATGSTAYDVGVVALLQDLLKQLAAAVDVSALR